MKKKSLILLTLFLILVAGVLGYQILTKQNIIAPLSPLKPSPTPTPIPLPKDYSLEISVQQAGTMLVVDKINMVKPGWLVIYKDDNGKIGQILEKAIPPLEQGSFEKNVFFLRDPLEAGQKYFAVIQDDKGQIVVNNKGETVSRQFQVK